MEAFLRHRQFPKRFQCRLCGARELTRQAAASALRAGDKEKENVALALDSGALREAAFGNSAEARQAASDALMQSPTSRAVEVEAALALATAGDTARAESLTQDLAKRFRLDTQVQSLWLPTIRAQLAITGRNPTVAIDRLIIYKTHHPSSWD
jgi:predicted Zn-dependent protease